MMEIIIIILFLIFLYVIFMYYYLKSLHLKIDDFNKEINEIVFRRIQLLKIEFSNFNDSLNESPRKLDDMMNDFVEKANERSAIVASLDDLYKSLGEYLNSASDIKKSFVYNEDDLLIEQLTDLRREYNKSVASYSLAINTFPNTILLGFFKFKKIDYLRIMTTDIEGAKRYEKN